MKVYKFNNPERARSFSDGCIKLHIILLGDDGKYWVASFADAQRLEKQGYEVSSWNF